MATAPERSVPARLPPAPPPRLLPRRPAGIGEVALPTEAVLTMVAVVPMQVVRTPVARGERELTMPHLPAPKVLGPGISTRPITRAARGTTSTAGRITSRARGLSATRALS